MSFPFGKHCSYYNCGVRVRWPQGDYCEEHGAEWDRVNRKAADGDVTELIVFDTRKRGSKVLNPCPYYKCPNFVEGEPHDPFCPKHRMMRDSLMRQYSETGSETYLRAWDARRTGQDPWTLAQERAEAASKLPVLETRLASTHDEFTQSLLKALRIDHLRVTGVDIHVPSIGVVTVRVSILGDEGLKTIDWNELVKPSEPERPEGPDNWWKT